MKDIEKVLTLLLGTILEMSDEAQKLGGATSIAGVASLHKMQTSIQKNRTRIMQAVDMYRKEVV